MANLSSKTGTVTTPVQAQLSLANNSVTSIQDFSAYDAQEISGFVFVDATSDYRASFTVSVVKNGAGTYEVAASNIQGDDLSGSPIVSFSMSGSILQATLGNFSGFASAYVRYQLSAPYLGGNYPLTVSASQVQGNISGTITAGYIGQLLSSTGTCSSTSPTTMTSITLTQGVWVVSAHVNLTAVGSGVTNVCCAISETTNSVAGLTYAVDQMRGGVSAGGGYLYASATISNLHYNNTSASRPLYLVGFTEGSALTLNGSIRAVRIG